MSERDDCRLVNNRRRYHWSGKPGDAFRRILGWTLLPVFRVKAPTRIVSRMAGAHATVVPPTTPENP